MPIREYDLEFEGTTVHCYEGGSGRPILMLHGTGPGAGTAAMWSRVLGRLARRYHVLAADLIGFGRSGVKAHEPYYDLDMWSRQARMALDRLAPRGPVGVIGHSLSGYLVLRLAANNKRIDKVLATGAMGARFKKNDAITFAWTMPDSEQGLRELYKIVSTSPPQATEQFVADRFKLINTPGYRDYFTRMFKGDAQRYMNQATLTKSELARITQQVVLLYGAQDRPVPFTQAAVPLANAIPQADLIRLANCGHAPSLDQPEKFLSVVRSLFG